MLEGELVRLRALEPEDADKIYGWVHDPEVGRWMVNDYPRSRAQIRKRCEERPVNNYELVVLGIETKAEGELIGIVDLRDADPRVGNAELDIYIGDAEYRGGGYGTDAMRVMCRYGFDAMRLHMITLWVVAGNERARHVYRKVGFSEDGRHREAFVGEGGRRHDMILMSMLKGELT
ncbi:GNAT family N-acetyltransferase [Amycolatopsis rifamycinica]|uniref:GNAT family acetyltransferase n=1 Tax=Amycolatopsis rifamycinica TaxID=287986 RepID=A0A066U118_9PSEU|nr:GNAT family N-acetyltransferase [Amycolatopsis rifamycinica]KDN17933.1 GNAT family acetyltransferase [Amycolatopsis rifamycinica]